MDLFCAGCGEPWNLDHVLHDAPEDFQRKGSLILSCPCCKSAAKKSGKSSRTRAARVIGDLMGDDIDGAAAMTEDFLWWEIPD